MDVSVDEVRASVLPSWFPRRRARAGRLSKGLTQVLATDRVARWEWGLTVAALFVLGRTSVLFFRRHLAGAFGGLPSPLWQNDLVITLTFAVAQLAIIAVAIRRARPSALLRQPALLGFLAFVWLSTSWSIEPAVTARRSLLFAGAAGVGWYIGDRFSFHDHLRLLAWLGGVACGTTILAMFFWNVAARSTNGALGQWSGVYVNRNSLGLVLSLGFLAVMFLLRTTTQRGWLRFFGFVLFFVLLLTRSRTGLVGLAVALTVAIVMYWIRRLRGHALRAGPAAYVVFATLATVGLVVHWYWYDLLRWLGREPDLTGRTMIWQLVGWFGRLHPWRGFGFEAIWANEHTIGQAQGARGSLGKAIVGGWPFTAHNGYYEIMLGVGRVGLLLFVVFLGLLIWKAFQHAWVGTDTISLWPLSLIVFVVVVNFSESLFVSSEAVWALTVATAVGLTGYAERAADTPQTRPGST